MSIPLTVVISCAGEGRRLGLSKTKALVDVLGMPLIGRHLQMLRHIENLRIAVGFQAADVIEYVNSVRRDVVFVFNHDYSTTGTAESVSRAASGVEGSIVSLDGDLLVHPEDFEKVVHQPDPCLGVLPITSDDPVLVQIDHRSETGKAIGFSRTNGDMEWSGLFKAPVSVIDSARDMGTSRGHVYQMLEASLPMRTVEIRAREIDTPADYDRAIAWIRPIIHHWDR
jgi:choline kinase